MRGECGDLDAKLDGDCPRARLGEDRLPEMEKRATGDLGDVGLAVETVRSLADSGDGVQPLPSSGCTKLPGELGDEAGMLLHTFATWFPFFARFCICRRELHFR